VNNENFWTTDINSKRREYVLQNLTCSPDVFHKNLTGHYFENHYNFIEISFDICKDKNCKSEAEIDEFFENNGLQIVYKDYYLLRENLQLESRTLGINNINLKRDELVEMSFNIDKSTLKDGKGPDSRFFSMG